MKRVLLAFVLALLAVPSHAAKYPYFSLHYQVVACSAIGTSCGGGFSGGTVGGSTTFSGAVTFSSTTNTVGAATFGDGSVGTPSWGWNSDNDGTGTGAYRSAANEISFSINGNQRYIFQSGAFLAANSSGVINATGITSFNTASIGFASASSVTVSSTPDTYFTRESAAVLQLGSDVNGAVVNYSIKAGDGITGSDIKGSSLSLKPGLGTGAAVSGVVDQYRDLTKATGTTAQTYGQSFVSCPSKILSNTSATATTIATITTTSTTGGSVTFDYSVVANNGTLQDIDSGVTKVSWGNNAGTVAATMSAVALQSDQDASGTLAATPTATVATNVVSIKLTPTWTVIVPTTVTAFYNFQVFGQDSVACQ